MAAAAAAAAAAEPLLPAGSKRPAVNDALVGAEPKRQRRYQPTLQEIADEKVVEAAANLPLLKDTDPKRRALIMVEMAMNRSARWLSTDTNDFIAKRLVDMVAYCRGVESTRVFDVASQIPALREIITGYLIEPTLLAAARSGKDTDALLADERSARTIHGPDFNPVDDFM